MALSVREITREVLNITGPISVRRDLFTIRDLPPTRSVRDALTFLAFEIKVVVLGDSAMWGQWLL